jgi:4-hydroxy-tetrahydrodipicolinate synthase
MVEFGIEHGAAGFLCTALAGEVEQLSSGERLEVAKAVIAAAEDKVAVVVGLGSGPFDSTLNLAREAESAGAAAVLLPAQSRWQDLTIDPVDDIAGLADAVAIEVMLQEAPRYADTSFGLPVILRACTRLSNRCSVKMEGGSAALAELVRAAVDVPVWGGDGGLYMLGCLRVGAAGVIPGLELIDRLAAAYALELDACSQEADEVMWEVLPFLVQAMQSQATYVTSAKRLLAARGLIRTADARVAGSPLTAAAAAALDRSIRRAAGAATTLRLPTGSTG